MLVGGCFDGSGESLRLTEMLYKRCYRRGRWNEPVLGRSHQLLHVTHVFRAGLRCLKGVPGLANELEGRSSWLHTISDIIIFPGSNAGT